MKKILITGANSFIGSYFKKHTSHNVLEVDLLSVASDEIDFTNVDVVFHVAAIVHQDQGTPDDIYYRVNRDLAVDVARNAKLHGVKQFVFMSTVKVYGENSSLENPWTETSECFPTDAYGKSKLEAEHILSTLSEDSFFVTIIRTPVVYGANVKGNIRKIAQLVSRVPIIPLGNIKNIRAMVYIGNLVALINICIDKRYAGIALAADNVSIGTSDLVHHLVGACHKKRYVMMFPSWAQWLIKKIKPTFYQRLFGSMVIDNSVTRECLSFHAPYEVELGIKEVIKHL